MSSSSASYSLLRIGKMRRLLLQRTQPYSSSFASYAQRTTRLNMMKDMLYCCSSFLLLPTQQHQRNYRRSTRGTIYHSLSSLSWNRLAVVSSKMERNIATTSTMTTDASSNGDDRDGTTTMTRHNHNTLLLLESEIHDAHVRQDKVWIRRIPSQIRSKNDNDGDDERPDDDDNDSQYGIFARCDIPKGEVVMEGRRQRTKFSNNDESSSSSSSSNKRTTLTTSIRNEPGTHTIQIDWNKHITLDLPSRFVNHICGVANVGIQRPPSNSTTDNENDHNDDNDDMVVYYNFIALTNIRKGDEILWDYECSEYELLNDGFTCTCGGKYCRRQIRGYKYHGPTVLQTYGKEYIAPYLLQHQS